VTNEDRARGQRAVRATVEEIAQFYGYHPYRNHRDPVSCDLATCIIVLQQWDALRRAIAGDKSLSFSIST